MTQHCYEGTSSNGVPCGACPWVQKGQPDITSDVRAAAERGQWFCCHVHLGTCHGARRYSETKAVAQHQECVF